mmetsp:Transcript_48698/g.139233  ORF Transcript_48698/g.139233 Transcript_48698/m.139233 type:complete len:308 (-) Transcript_48698:38-961(-)
MALVENRIFVNHVPQTAKREDLAAHFSQFGATVDVYMPSAYGALGQHKGMCFISYATPASVELVLKFPAHVIHGQQVSVDLCMTKKGDGKGLPGMTNSGERVFVTNIGPDITQEEVQTYFAQWGGWSDFFMPKGAFPTGHKGICFISYKDSISVAQLLRHGVHQIRGQPVVVDVAVPRGPAGGKGAAPMAPTGPAMPVYGTAPPPSMQPGGAVTMPGRLFITKMAKEITRDDLAAYFQQFGQLNDVYVPPGGKLIAFVGFHDAMSANTVLQLRTHEVKPGCTVDVDAAVERPPLGSKGQGKTRFQPY